MIYFDPFYVGCVDNRWGMYAVKRDGGLRLVETHASYESARASCAWWIESGRLA